jgi:glycosyltransferase involved in cell wall biosynthesis
VSDRIDVSVVIPTRDSAADLGRCLPSIRAQTGVRAEAIVVDQESRDETPDVAASYGAAVITTPRSDVYTPPTRSRNLGASRARGEYLLHLDADMTLSPNALAAAVASCRHDGYVALTLEEADVHWGFWAACKALERGAYRNTKLEAARFVRADVFASVDGYDESLGSGEDWDIHARYQTRGRIGRLPGAISHHLGTVSLRGQLRKKFSYGRSAAAFLATHESRDLSRAMLAAYARSWRSFARHPAHALGFVALRLGEAGALTAGHALEALRRRRAGLG